MTRITSSISTVLLVLSLVIVIDAKCVGGSPYLWSNIRCFCDMQKYANNNGSPPDAKAYWMGYSAGFSKGYCKVCSLYFNGIDDAEEEPLSTDDGTLADLRNDKIVFPIMQCLTKSSHFMDYAGCVQWARTKTHVFVNDKWNIRYTAKFRASPAYCNLCGPTDPCNGEIRG
ncbi:hypothetical protein GEMRC1_001820 [Eukaryota sp. GEM-RC1]